MRDFYLDHLFSKGFLVGARDAADASLAAETITVLAEALAIRVSGRVELAHPAMIELAERNLGRRVPEPFYRGFPQSVRELSQFELAADQLLHYLNTYGTGNFEEVGHSFFEKDEEGVHRTIFDEELSVRDYRIITVEEAQAMVADAAKSLMASSRPLSDSQYELVRAAYDDFDLTDNDIASKDTVVRLLLDTRDVSLSRHLALSDVMRLVERLQWERYDTRSVRKLNLRNRDRKLIAAVLDALFERGGANVVECYEKRRQWSGLLHHLHWRPRTDEARAFADAIRGGHVASDYARFEQALATEGAPAAARLLLQAKGPAAVLRNLDYLLSRCAIDEDVLRVLECAKTRNKLVLVQLLLHYASYSADLPRVFKFQKMGLLRVHEETPEEAARRKSTLSAEWVELLRDFCRRELERLCKGALGKVYVDSAMHGVALPVQEGTSMGGVGTLPKGTRLPLEPGKKIRAFTYWELTDDIDLSCFCLDEQGRWEEFSWRTMASLERPWRSRGTEGVGSKVEPIVYSGDETSGYHGGSEYFDIEPQLFKENFPAYRYVVFCDNVYSRNRFSECLCRAGYMLRDPDDSGQVFEPATVASSFIVSCDSTFAYLFALDLAANEFVWLNVAHDSGAHVAGTTSLGFLLPYLSLSQVISLYDFACMLASEVLSDPAQADVVFSDKNVDMKDGAERIRSCDFERVMELLSA